MQLDSASPSQINEQLVFIAVFFSFFYVKNKNILLSNIKVKGIKKR
jgi:hypothetical protein